MEPGEEIGEQFLTVDGCQRSYCTMADNRSIVNMSSDEIQSILNKKLDGEHVITDTGPEVTVICVDNSSLLTRIGGLYKPQAKAIALYAEEKIRAHKCNEVGLLAMGFIQGRGFVEPTREINQIRLALNGLTYFGQSCIPIGQALTFFLNSNLPKRRLLVFSGGRLSMDSTELEFCATRLKEFKVAVDVVNFGIQFLPPTKAKFLEAFVKAADNDKNSHYLYAPSGSATSLGQQILCSPLAPGGLPMQEEKKKEKIDKKKMKHLLASAPALAEVEKKIEEEKRIEEEKVKKKEEEKTSEEIAKKVIEMAKKDYEEWVRNRKKLKKKIKKQLLRAEEKKKEEEEVKKKEKMEQRLLLPVEQLEREVEQSERGVLDLPLQEEKKKEEEVKKKKLLKKKMRKMMKQLLRAEEEKKKEEEEVKKKEKMEQRLLFTSRTIGT